MDGDTPPGFADGDELVTISSVNLMSHVDGGLEIEAYTYAVFCRDGAGNWQTEVILGDNAVTATPIDLTPPAAVDDLIAEPGIASVTLRFTLPSDEDLHSCDILRVASDYPLDPVWENVHTLSIGEPEHIAPDYEAEYEMSLELHGVFTYTVRCRDIEGNPQTEGKQVFVMAHECLAGDDVVLSAYCDELQYAHCSNNYCAPEGFAYIRSGSFLMGAPSDDLFASSRERTQSRVTITRPFFMQLTETTQEEWLELVTPNPSTFAACGGSCPVEGTNWFDAVKFANLLSVNAGRPECYELTCTGSHPGLSCTTVNWPEGLDCEGFRLPTEAEWEYAARAETTTVFYTGTLESESGGKEPLATALDAAGWYGGNSTATYGGNAVDCSTWFAEADLCGTQAVGQKEQNAWGLFDMHGNIAEWVWNINTNNYDDLTAVDPTGPASGDYRVFRGGSWKSDASGCRSTFRNSNWPTTTLNDIGFRLVRTVPIEPESTGD